MLHLQKTVPEAKGNRDAPVCLPASPETVFWFLLISMDSHRSVPTFEEPVVKSGFLLKKGARSSSYSKRCAVLLPDRLVIYENPGDSNAIVKPLFSFHLGLR